jgi:hypothetical protein
MTGKDWKDTFLLALANLGRRVTEWAERKREPGRCWIEDVKETYR